MPGIRRPVLLALAAVAVAPATAPASTTFGTVTATFTGDSGLFQPTVVLQAEPLYAAPSAGVVTALSTRANAGTITIGLLRGTPPGSLTVVGSEQLTGATGSPIVTKATRIPVQAGDHLAAGLDGSTQIRYRVSAAAGLWDGDGALPGAGGTVTFTGSAFAQQTAIAATLEPDADGDGYGDETQDSCPALAAIHAGPCTVDMVASGAESASAPAGVAAVVAASVGVSGAAGTSAGKVTVGVPAGVDVLAVSAAGGTCDGLTCTLGAIAPGTSRRIVVVVRSATQGSYPVLFSASASETLVNVGDDAATATYTATAPLSTQSAVKLCTVPKLKGLTRASATTKLAAAGCALGKASGSKKKKAKVRTQTIPAGTQVVAGTKVGVRLG